MTIREFVEMFVDPDCQEFRVWSDNKEDNIFTGYLDDCPDDISDMEINSIDNISTASMLESKVMTLNVD